MSPGPSPSTDQETVFRRLGRALAGHLGLALTMFVLGMLSSSESLCVGVAIIVFTVLLGKAAVLLRILSRCGRLAAA
jgi:hypothetical protein